MTDTPKFTPRPWHTTLHGPIASEIVFDANGFAICDCKVFHGRHRKGEGTANALLIAAAPEMYAALKEWKCPSCGGKGTYEHCGNKGEVERTGRVRHPHPNNHVTTCKKCNGSGLHPTASAALAKAEGKGEGETP